MGVWDMLYLTQKYKKVLEHAVNPAFSPETRAEFSMKAEQLRAQIARYLARVEKQQQVQELLKAKMNWDKDFDEIPLSSKILDELYQGGREEEVTLYSGDKR